MFENRNLKLDLFALALLAAVIFLGLALVTYSPGDTVGELIRPLDQLYRPDTLVYPANAETRNACGRWGALAADMSFNALGLGAFYLVFSLGVLDVRLLRRRNVDTPVIRSVGWFASLLGFTTVVSMLMPTWSPGPVIGAGGYLGALGAGLLEMHFATLGGVVLAVSLVVGGLLLCTDYTLLRVARGVAKVIFVGVSVGRDRVKAGRRVRGAKADDLIADVSGVEDDVVELPVRIRGKRPADNPVGEEDVVAQKPVADNAVPTSVASDPPDDEDEAEQAMVVPVVAKKTPRAKAGKVSASPHFNIRQKPDKSEREKVMSQLDDAARADEAGDYELPTIDLLLEGDEVSYDAQETEVRRKAKILEQTFAEFGFKVRVVEIETGPVIAQYEVQLEAGLRLSKITSLADDLAIALRVPSVRIVAPIPGKNTVGIEVPNEHRQVVRLREVMEEDGGKARKMKVPIFLGKDVSGNPMTVDLATLPHLLIAGRTGTGKSVCLNAIISSILMTKRPDEVRMLMIDPKMVELSGYARLPHLMHPVVTDMRKAEAILAWAVEKMEERYALLAKAGVRHISSYNQLGEEELLERLELEDEEQRKAVPLQLPFIVIVADEIADLMMTAGKEVEQHIIRLAQKSRAVGIHLILATQKPTVDVITGLIKSNLPARIAFQVASRTDSRVVLDEMGADKLLGNGDMLFLWPGTSTLLRGQGTYLSDDEIDAITDAVSMHEQHFVTELVNMKIEDAEDSPGPLKNRDDLYESAVDIVVREGRGSVSLLQRSLGIGYGRAARLIDFMAEDNIVGAYAGSQAREVKITLAEWEQMQGLDPAEQSEPEPAPAAKKRSNKIVPRAEPADDDDEALAAAKQWRDDEIDDSDEDNFADYDEVDRFEEEYESESA